MIKREAVTNGVTGEDRNGRPESPRETDCTHAIGCGAARPSAFSHWTARR
jgi:hypothetical protein